VLTNPVRAGALQLAMVAKQIKEAEEGPQDVPRKRVARLVEMGFGERAARVALKDAGGRFRPALEALMAQGDAARTAGGGGGGGGDEDGAGPSGAGGEAAAAPARGGGRRRRRRARPRRRRASAAGGSGSDSEWTSASGPGSGSGSGSGSGGSDPADSEEEAMEAAIVDAARGGGDDPMAAYDLDLAAEEAAIQRYLALLQ
jgi:hypothetical protein